VGLPQGLRRQWAAGGAHAKEPGGLEALFALAQARAQAQAAEGPPVLCRPDHLASVGPSGAAQEPLAAPAAASVAVLAEALRQGEGSPAQLAALGAGTTGAIRLAVILSYPGLRLEGSGRCCGLPKTTGRRWLSPLAQGPWQGAVQQGRRCFSGTMAVAEKGRTLAGVWW
jgi:hypothetical protein